MRINAVLLSIVLLLSACSSGSGSDSTLRSPEAQAEFLIDNASRDGVLVTESGLQYEVLRAAEGAMPDQNSTVTVHYVGTLVNGSEFDSSYRRNQPNTFVLAGTIDGWVEGVQLMSVGSQFRFVMPPELGYGDRGAGTQIPPGAVLIFEVELLEINSM